MSRAHLTISAGFNRSFCGPGNRRARDGKASDLLGPIDFDNLPENRKCRICRKARERDTRDRRFRGEQAAQRAIHAIAASTAATVTEEVEPWNLPEVAKKPSFTTDMADEASTLFNGCLATLDLLSSVKPGNLCDDTVTIAAFDAWERLCRLKTICEGAIETALSKESS